MVMLSLDSKQLDSSVQVKIDIQGQHRNLQITAEGPNIYEAIGACMAKIVDDQNRTDLKVTWVRCRPYAEEWTIIQETKNGEPIDVRWGTNLFADLFEPVYRYLKDF